jgi:hypothetical protein
MVGESLRGGEGDSCWSWSFERMESMDEFVSIRVLVTKLSGIRVFWSTRQPRL